MKNEDTGKKTDDLKDKINHQVENIKKGTKEEASQLMSKAKEGAKEILKENVKDQVKSVGAGLAGAALANNPLMLKIKLIITGVVILVSYIGLCFAFPQLNLFYRKPFKLKETAVIIEESKKIAKLFSANYYAEIVIDTTKTIYETKTNYTNSIINLFTDSLNDQNTEYIDSSLHQITIIGNGTTFAANDLSRISKEDIEIKDSICIINIKSAEIVNTVINPSDFTIFIDEGNWNPKEVQDLKTIAVNKIESYAIKNEILEKADKRTKRLLVEFLKSIGFSIVKVNFKK